MAEVKCPICGQMNPSNAQFCGNCRASLNKEGDSIQPGEMPTKKVTAELEPILPAWLRDARDRSRQSDPSDENKIEDLSQQAPPAAPSAPSSDLLAGLQSQANDDDEDIPDWLAGITGAASKKKAQPGSGENRFVDMGGAEKAKTPSTPEPAQEAESELPSWLSSLSAPQTPGSSSDDLGDWLKKTESAPIGKTPSEDASSMDAFGAFSDVGNPPADAASGADWLSGMQSDASIAEETSQKDAEPFADVDLPAWLRGDEPAAPSPAASNAMPAWLKSLDAESSAPKPEPTPEPETSAPAPDSAPTDFDTPDWLKSMAAPGTPAPAADTTPTDFDTPDWLKSMAAPEASAPVVAPTPTDFDAPDWLKNSSETPTPPAPEPVSPQPTLSNDFDVDLPSWLKGAKVEADEPVEASMPSWLETSTPAADVPASAPASASAFTDFPDEISATETPDWLSNLGLKPVAPEQSKSFNTETSIPPLVPEEADAAFTEEPFPSGDLDTLFTDMPDWLTGITASTPAAAEPPSAEEPDTTISPASLPSWVQAMRPVEAAMSTTVPRGVSGDETLETLGPLAGLHGVLPSVPIVGASIKPKSQAARLQADDEQQSHATLLEQILAAETRPEPMVSAARVNSQRALRIVISVLLFSVILGSIFMGTQFFPLPLGRPAETMAAFNVVDVLVPPDAPVLVIFDYEPALAGEMEAAAAPLLDHLIVKQHPRLALLSTSPTGATLAEHMLSQPLGDLPGIQYVNLGYLPGGLSGVRAFAQDPVHTVIFPADVSFFNLNPLQVWQSTTLQGVQAFSNFAAIIVITDSAETGRTWIEQAGPLRGNSPLVMVSSAQAGPMFQPYYRSGQLGGLVTGLYDGAVLEQYNASRPGYARRYWDAYNFSLLLVVLLLVGGILWSLVANLRERISSKEAGA